MGLFSNKEQKRKTAAVALGEAILRCTFESQKSILNVHTTLAHACEVSTELKWSISVEWLAFYLYLADLLTVPAGDRVQKLVQDETFDVVIHTFISVSFKTSQPPKGFDVQSWHNKLFTEIVDYWEEVGPKYRTCKYLGLGGANPWGDTAMGTLLDRMCEITLQKGNLDDGLIIAKEILTSVGKSLIEDKLGTKVKDLIASL